MFKKIKIRPFRLLWRIFLGLCLLLSLVLLFFKYTPPPTSSFIFKQNQLAKQHPKTYLPAKQTWVDWQDMSPYLALAAIAAEDQKFLVHYGFDLTQIQLVLKSKSKQLRGASTISQQLAKNLFLWNGRSFIRKGLEALIVPFMELIWSKKRILEVYLNVVQFGPVTYGVHRASLSYFGKLPKNLNQSEAAWLIAVLPSPGRSKINKPSTKLKKRHAWIVKQMAVLKQYGVLKKLKSQGF